MHASQISIKLIASACLFAGAFGVPLPGGGFDPTGFHAQNAMGQMGGRIEEFAPNAWKSGADGEFDGGFTAMDPISPHSGDAGMMHFPASKGQGAQRYPLLNALNAINPGSSSEAFSEDDWIPPLASTGTPEKAAHELQYDPTLDDILPDDDMGIADTATGTHFGDLGPQFGHQTRQSAFDGLDIEALLNQHPELLDMDDDSLPELPSLPSIPKLQGLDYGIAEGNMGRQAVPQHASPVGHHDPDFLSDFLRMQRERQQSLGLQDADLIDQFLHDGLPAVGPEEINNSAMHQGLVEEGVGENDGMRIGGDAQIPLDDDDRHSVGVIQRQPQIGKHRWMHSDGDEVNQPMRALFSRGQ